MITIKLTFKEVELLLMAFIDWQYINPYHYEYYKFDDQRAELLNELQYEFCIFLEKYRVKDKKSYNIKFSSLQALAFIQMWQDRELPVRPETVVILELMAIFDKASKEPKKYQDENNSGTPAGSPGALQIPSPGQYVVGG